jgi:uncharacterized protein
LPSEDFAAWRQARQRELAGPDSWLGLIGLFWLENGRNSVGSAPASTVLLPTGPAHLGDIEWTASGIFWQPAGKDAIELKTDQAGQPTVIEHEHLAFFIVEREGRLAVRLRDRQWAARRPFAGLDCFAFDPAWCVEALWQPLSPPLHMEVPNVAGDLKSVEVAWRAVFSVDGQEFGLLPMAVGEDEVFFIFRDQTSGRQSYGAGRFLKAGPALDGRILLDFNRATNPPCAFTSFATCPLPPPENWLPFAVMAGEMKPPDSAH